MSECSGWVRQLRLLLTWRENRVKGPTTTEGTRYTPSMETVVLIGLAIVVALVSIDAIARLDERRDRGPRADAKDPTVTTTQKIVVDLSKRR